MPTSRNPSAILPGAGKQQGGANIQAAISAINLHVNDPANAHAASAISYAGGGAWIDGTANPATTAELQLDKVVSDLSDATSGAARIGKGAGPVWVDGATTPAANLSAWTNSLVTALVGVGAADSGAHKVGSGELAAATGTPAIAAASINTQLVALKSAANLSLAARSAWIDGGTNPAINVYGGIEKIVTDLASGVSPSGAHRIGSAQINGVTVTIPAGNIQNALVALQQSVSIDIGTIPNWLGGRTNPNTNLSVQVKKIINDLAVSTDGADDGAIRIGAAAVGDLTVGSVRSQLNLLDTGWGKRDRAGTWSETQNFQGPINDYDAAIEMNRNPTLRKLLFRFRTDQANAGYGRMYGSRDTASGFELVVNAAWDGAQWVPDNATQKMGRYYFEPTNSAFIIQTHAAGASSFNTADWKLDTSLELRAGNPAYNATGNVAPNRLYSKNIIKCWGNVTMAGGTATINDGFNIASVNYTPSDAYLTVLFDTNMGDATYGGWVQDMTVSGSLSDDFFRSKLDPFSTAGCRIYFAAHGGAPLDLATADVKFAFQIIGSQ